MFEKKHEPLLPRRAFYARVARSAAVTAAIIAFSLLLGTVGYHYLGALPWVDAFLEASMILTGMGPIAPLKTTAVKLFSAFYALYSGIAFLTMIAVLFAPLLHRVLHKFHLEEEESRGGGKRKK